MSKCHQSSPGPRARTSPWPKSPNGIDSTFIEIKNALEITAAPGVPHSSRGFLRMFGITADHRLISDGIVHRWRGRAASPAPGGQHPHTSRPIGHRQSLGLSHLRTMSPSRVPGIEGNLDANCGNSCWQAPPPSLGAYYSVKNGTGEPLFQRWNCAAIRRLVADRQSAT